MLGDDDPQAVVLEDASFANLRMAADMACEQKLVKMAKNRPNWP